MATFTSTHGPDPTYTAFVFTVTCEVTSFALPSNPSDESYTLFTAASRIDLSNLVYVQTPACGYAYTSTLTWTGLETFITSTTDFVVDVYSQSIAHAGASTGSPSTVYPLTLANTLAIASNGPAGASSFAHGGSTIGFSVTITNPCYTTSIPTLTFNPSALLSVTDGATGSIEFVRSTNGVETSTGVALICGDYAFEVYQDTSDTALSAAWVTISPHSTTPGTYTFDVDTTLDTTLITTQSSQDYTVYVKAYLVDYTDIVTYTAKIVQVVAATCDCTALAWDNPSAITPTIQVNIGSTETIPLPAEN